MDELPVVAGVNGSADQTGSASYEMRNRAYYEPIPIPDTIDPRTAFNSGINMMPRVEQVRQNAQQYGTSPYSFWSEGARLDSGEYMDISGQMVASGPLKQAGKVTPI